MKNKRLGISWWILPLLFGLGLLFLFIQTPNPYLAGNTSTNLESGQKDNNQTDEQAQAESEKNQAGQEENITKDEAFLAEYDAISNSFVDNDVDNERPAWQVSVELGLKLILVIGFIYAALAGLRWLQGSRNKITGNRGSSINVVETTNLAPNRALHMVIIGEKTLLIGSTDSQLSLLADLSDANLPLSEELSLQGKHPYEFDEALDWQMSLGTLRSGIQRFREAVGGK